VELGVDKSTSHEMLEDSLLGYFYVENCGMCACKNRLFPYGAFFLLRKWFKILVKAAIRTPQATKSS
jgi:hypothetical protein